MKVSKLTVGEKRFDLSDTMYGISLEDINWALDGGLNANMVNNHSFDAQFFPKYACGSLMALTKRAPEPVWDRLRFWHAEGVSVDSRVTDGADPRSYYARIASPRYGVLENKGYNGGKRHKNDCGMCFSQGAAYAFSCYVRNLDFEGTVLVSAVDESGRALTEPQVLPVSYEWERPSLSLIAVKGGYGKLRFTFDGAGRLDLDCVILRPEDVWGKKDPKWSEGKLRRDLVESIAALKPRFLRFPCGLPAQGAFCGNEYNWKNSVGPTIGRVGQPNARGLRIPDRGMFQSLQIGFYEFFCLCEDLGCEPVPTLWEGANSRLFSRNLPEPGSAAFEQAVNDILDLLDFALSKPAKSKWAGLRAEMGHKAPFALHMLAIGSEHYGPAYQQAFELLKTEVNLKFPGVRLVMAADVRKKDRSFCGLFETVGSQDDSLILDEHFRRGRIWFYLNSRRFGSYPRGGAALMVGGYAARSRLLPQKPGSFASALSEAAFLTGAEQNGDLVRMLSYAPLLGMAEGSTRRHSLIVFNPAHVMKSANYQVQELFSNQLGSFVPALTGKLPAGVYASVSEDESCLYLKLVNARFFRVGLACGLPFERGRAVLSLYRSRRGLRANRLRFTGEPEYRLALEEQQYDIFDGSLGMCLSGRSLAVIRIRKNV